MFQLELFGHENLRPKKLFFPLGVRNVEFTSTQIRNCDSILRFHPTYLLCWGRSDQQDAGLGGGDRCGMVPRKAWQGGMGMV